MRDHLNQIVKKSTVELTAMFNSEGKNIFTGTMQKELKGLGFHSGVALRKSLISEVNLITERQFM